jgi:hypothetical protein
LTAQRRRTNDDGGGSDGGGGGGGRKAHMAWASTRHSGDVYARREEGEKRSEKHAEKEYV